MNPFEAVGLTQKGSKAKDQNEDSFLSVPELGLFAVADGMGGYPGGDLASQIATETLKEFFLSESAQALSPEQALIQGIQAANFVIFDHASKNPALFGMGTTVVSLYFQPGPLIAHVGDSRAYVLRNRKLTALTQDHSVVENLADGTQKSTLSRAVGCDDSVKVEASKALAEIGDLFLLCSDGLTCSLSERDIERILNTPQPLKDQAEKLIRCAALNGSTDDITVVLVRWA